MVKKSPIRFRLENMEKATIPLPGFESDKFARFGHLWRLIGVLGLILTLYQVNILQIDYFTYPYDTRISVIKVENEAIPSMEICIFNKVQCSMIKRNLQDPQGELVRETCQILIHSRCSVPPDLMKICRANNPMFESDVETSTNLTMKEHNLAIDAILGSSVPLQQKLNEDYETFIHSCNISNQSCSEYQYSNVNVDALQPSFNPAIGACAKLNWNGSIKIDEQGLNVEIVVKLNLEDPTHQGIGDAQAGVKVTFDREKAFRTENRVRSLPDPYLAKCTNGWENTAIAGMYDDFKRTIEEFTYDLDTCSNICQLERTYNECGNCLWSKFEEGSFQTAFYKKFTKTLLVSI
ncbi:hypothetical protein TCAL_05012 [Tigriopus californicus]|uniref:Uncharacterized protein n=1 Tax=Tigriopus californicus TaxID=6832 RepID=A0A553PKX2_TIGCA|nr:hypothetical protein TCAL_05012 [Tigriopus californicus]